MRRMAVMGLKDYKMSRLDILILAGGKSSRMNGNHKGNLRCGEQTFMQHLVSEMKKVSDYIWISYGEAVHEEFEGCRIVKDVYQNCGPIGGIHAGLSQMGETNAEYIAVAACDMPFMKAEFFETLLVGLAKSQRMNAEETSTTIDAVIPVTSDGRIHPLAAIYRKSILPIVDEQLKSGNYRLRDMLDKIKVQYLDVSEDYEMEEMLRNINTIEDYRKLKS